MSPTPNPSRDPWRLPLPRVGCLVCMSFLAMFFLGCVYSVATSFVKEDRRIVNERHARQIVAALGQYTRDHQGRYPEGSSSTEVFQQLLDQKYVTDPTLFYLPMTGKAKARDMKLKPENVCWDVTNAVLSSDPDTLPLVFSTGYHMIYLPNVEIFQRVSDPPPGLAIGYKNNRVIYLKSDGNGIILNSISRDFDPKGRTYQQLTPEGPLP